MKMRWNREDDPVRRVEIAIAVGFIACLAWWRPSDSSSGSVVCGVAEARIVEATLDYLWTSNYGIPGDFIVVTAQSAVPFPGESVDCTFGGDTHQVRIDRLTQSLVEKEQAALAQSLHDQNLSRVSWQKANLKTIAELRSPEVLESVPSSAEFYARAESVLRKVGGRAHLELSRPAIDSQRALLFVIDHREWPSRALLVSLEQNDGGRWEVVDSHGYPQPSHCSCGPSASGGELRL